MCSSIARPATAPVVAPIVPPARAPAIAPVTVPTATPARIPTGPAKAPRAAPAVGPHSKVTNHHVEIEFSSFSALISSTGQNAVNQVKRWLAGGKIKFECDCERHTFWYRYMATIGGYGLGRKENGYPKLRNPLLSGVACKHVLKTVYWIQSPSGIEYLKKEVQKDRTRQLSVRKKQTDRQILAELDQQVSAANKETDGKIQPNIRKAEQEMIRRAAKVAKKHFAKQQKMERQAQDALDRNKYAEWRNSGIVTDEVFQELMRRFK